MTVVTQKALRGFDKEKVSKERALADFGSEMSFRDKKGEMEPRHGVGILTGHFAVFNRWTEIDSWMEGNFMERLAPGSFTKTFKENGSSIRCLFNHGRDPSVGLRPLGEPRSLEQDDTGARYDVDLFDSTYVRDLVPAIKSGQLGASFRFQVVEEQFDMEPKRSDHNPKGLPERTITQVRCSEFGPVTFPAYADATAGLRSINELLQTRSEEELRRMSPEEHLRALELMGFRVKRKRNKLEVKDPKRSEAEPAKTDEVPAGQEGSANVDTAPAEGENSQREGQTDGTGAVAEGSPTARTDDGETPDYLSGGPVLPRTGAAGLVTARESERPTWML